MPCTMVMDKFHEVWWGGGGGGDTTTTNLLFIVPSLSWESLRHKKIPENYVLDTLLTGNAWLFNRKKKSLAYQVSTSYFRIFRFLGVWVIKHNCFLTWHN